MKQHDRELDEILAAMKRGPTHPISLWPVAILWVQSLGIAIGAAAKMVTLFHVAVSMTR